MSLEAPAGTLRTSDTRTVNKQKQVLTFQTTFIALSISHLSVTVMKCLHLDTLKEKRFI
jgi:hypothetical protein